MHGKHNEFISMTDSYWTRSQFEITAFIGWFQSGDQSGPRVRNKWVSEKRSTSVVECSNLETDSLFSRSGDKKKIRKEINVVCAHKNVVELVFVIFGENNVGQREMMIESNK